MAFAHGGGDREFVPIRIAVLTVSDSRDEQSDKSGRLLVDRLAAAGHQLAEKLIVRDDVYLIRAAISRWIADPQVNVVITTGGTGVTGRDGTPEAVEPLLDKVLEGFGEMFRSISYADIGTSTLQSRALAGVANAT
ncbi:MAG: molybdopterin adenylyltransferase, partial [Pseudomonadota bacterium]|nr:molybdopterin adenylyltransferase [Pseudomonadota bacterium]